MNWFRWAGLAVLVLIVLSAAIFALATPRERPHSAAESEVEARIWEAESSFSDLEFSDVELDGTRVIVTAEYTGEEEISDNTQWHELAKESADTLYHAAALNRGVEVRIYHNSSLQASAASGI